MPSHVRTFCCWLWLSVCVALAISCGPGEQPLAPRSQTWGELRAIRGAVTIAPPNEPDRSLLPRERLTDGASITVPADGLAWLRRDAGATLLVRGPAKLLFRAQDLQIDEGRVFIDSPGDQITVVKTPHDTLHLVRVRASLDVASGGKATEAYVLAGEVRAQQGAHASPGERLILEGQAPKPKVSIVPALAWTDWTGGLATTDREAQPPPFGIGTVGARRPGDQGFPRFALAIQRMEVRVTIDGDLATTEVDEIFFNGTSEKVEGMYTFRTPEKAALTRFGVDRSGVVVWGRVKEKGAAAAQYQANVYQGSTEDPALLEWDAPGVYRAKLYPIGPGETRRVVVRYSEWLERTGRKGERRLYVFPMAAEGSEESLPHVEFFGATFDLADAGAKEVRAGMKGVRDGNKVIVRAHDLVPRSDLALELYDDGAAVRGYRAPHAVDLEVLPPKDRDEARNRAKDESEYLLVPVRSDDVPRLAGGLDLVIVVDTSAATDQASLAISRAAVGALLSHMTGDDRAVVLAGDASLRPVSEGWKDLRKVDDAVRKAAAVGLASIERGGATDLGAMLGDAAAMLDPARRGAVVYVGDGKPTVGELGLADLKERLNKLARPVRIFGLGVGQDAEMGILKGISRAGFAERLTDASVAARASLRLLEVADRAAWFGVSVDLGTTVERIYPRDWNTLVAGESVLVVGRIKGAPPKQIDLNTPAGKKTLPLEVKPIKDNGDLRVRWAFGRLDQMLDEGAGRAAMVDLGSRNGIITPVTSYYVPTYNEMSSEERDELEKRRKRLHAELTGIKFDPERPATLQIGLMGCASKEESVPALSDGTETTAVAVDMPVAQGPAASAAPGAPMAAPPPATATAAATAEMDKKSGEEGRRAKGGDDSRAESTITGRPPASKAAARPKQRLANSDSESLEQREVDGLATIPADESGGLQGNTMGGLDGDMWNAGGLGIVGAGPGGGGGRLDNGIGAYRAPQVAASSAPATVGPRGGRVFNAKAAPEPGFGWEGKELAKTENDVQITVSVDRLPHRPSMCSGAADIPLEERVTLWRERLAKSGGQPRALALIYSRAIAACEAPTWRERSRLLSMMLDSARNVSSRVALWRIMKNLPDAADALYRGLLSRVKTPDEMRQLHAALGLRAMDPGTLEKLLKDAKTAGERVAKLRQLVVEWPDDFNLGLKLLDALEDAGDDAGVRDWGRRLRARPDVDAHVRTEVGEHYLRLAKRTAANKVQAAADEAEARRTFGEIVEFAPDEPVARRRLGDLLRAHGWYAESRRQYETLAKLAPDDASVQLLIAAASQGMGRLEEAVRWAEKISDAGAPGDTKGLARTARSMAVTFLAWGRDAAARDNRRDETAVLRNRSVRLLAREDRAKTAARVALTWSHPEIHPTLWSNALGAMMPAPEGDVTLGISQVVLARREGASVEVRVEPDELEHAARLGAKALLTVVFDEGQETEKVVTLPVAFARGGPNAIRFAIGQGEVRP
ncbi:MAG: hypothetical protein HY898_16005 [Deltaproteobacteria bacterium]|nr:hypothetical protein [Deltaproteobacteria bacterium]